MAVESEYRSLKSQAISGAGWKFGGSVASYGITFIVGVVLARLLSPEEYGLIGVITIFITIFNGIVDGGFTNALIRKQDAKDVDYSTAFITNLFVSIFLFVCLFFLAPLIARFFGNPLLMPLTRVMGICVIVNGFAIVQHAMLVKDIDFKTQTKISIISSLLSGVIGIGMALWGCGVWSLVGQQLSNKLTNTLLLWFFRKWWPQLMFSWQSFKALWNFGWKLLVSGLINSIWSEIYQVVIGKFYSPATLGQYTKAREYVALVSQSLSGVIQSVSYPVLSRVQDDTDRLKHGYRLVIRCSSLIIFFLVFLMAGSAKQLVLVLIGEKWLPCVPMMRIICFSLALYPLHALNLNMLQVQGRSDLFLKLEIVKKIIAIVPILAGIFINIYAMLIVGVFTGGVIDFLLNSHYSGRLIKYSSFQQIKDVLPSFAISLLVAIIAFLIGLINLSPFILLPIQLIFGFLVAVVICEFCHLEEYYEIKKMGFSIIKSMLNRNESV